MNIFCLQIYFPTWKLWEEYETQCNFCPRLHALQTHICLLYLKQISTISRQLLLLVLLVEIKLFFYFLFLLVSEHSRINSSVKNSRCPTRRRDDNWLIRSANHLATACRHERWIKTWRDREKDGPRDRFAVGTN